jgi:hypothetical protein
VSTDAHHQWLIDHPIVASARLSASRLNADITEDMNRVPGLLRVLGQSALQLI